MTRRKQIQIALMLAGLLTALAVIIGLGRPRTDAAQIVSLQRDVPAGQVLATDDLCMLSVPTDLVNPASFKAIADAVGLAPVHDLHMGQILDGRSLRSQPEGVAYPNAATDSRLYTLRVQPEHANGFWLAAGNRVDVHLIRRNDATRTAAEMLPDMLPAVRIAALIDTGGNSGQPIGTVAGQARESLVCLSVTAAEARILALSELSCLIKLIPLNEPVRAAGLDDPASAGSSGGLLEVENGTSAADAGSQTTGQ